MFCLIFTYDNGDSGGANCDHSGNDYVDPVYSIKIPHGAEIAYIESSGAYAGIT